MSEILVLFACLNKTGCSDTSSLYYAQNKEFQEFIKKNEDLAKDAVGPIFTQYYAPMLMVASGREATARISTRYYITYGREQQTITFKQEF